LNRIALWPSRDFHYRGQEASSALEANVYTYFSLIDGRKVPVNPRGELSSDQLEALDAAAVK
jgi:hypothetical protein